MFTNDGVEDVAVFKVREYSNLPSIALSNVQDIDLSENLVLLSKVLCIGYPPIPLTLHPFQVAVNATVSSLINIRGSSYLSYIISAMPRGGFSGGPIINEEGQAIALITESLCLNNQTSEAGFMSCLSISAATDLALEHGWNPDENTYYQDLESVAFIKLALSDTARLNPYAHDIAIYVYDDDRDVYFEISGVNKTARDLAFEAFNAECPSSVVKLEDNHTLIAFPQDNPSVDLLKKASRASRDALSALGYLLVRERYTEGWN